MFISFNIYDTYSKSYHIMLWFGSNSSIRDIMNINSNLGWYRLNKLSVNTGVLSGNFLYASKNRMFSSRSAATVVIKKINVSLESSLVLVGCEVQHVACIEKAKSFLKNYKSRIEKSPNSVKNTFTLGNMAKAYFEFELILHKCANLRPSSCISLQIYPLLCDPCYLLMAYSNLKRGSACGVDDVLISNVTLTGIISLAKRLTLRQYIPRSTKRIFIRKNNGKMRPLSISSTTGKIVQQSIYLILGPLFEPIFLDCSHGFRPKRGCHSALKIIYYRWKKIKWFIEADISQCFDKTSYSMLLRSINKRVDDYWLSMLISKLLKSGFIHFEGLTDSKLINKWGSPQGSILTPLFCNILLHVFDLEVRYIIDFINTKRNHITSAEHKKSVRQYSSDWKKVLNSLYGFTSNNVLKTKIKKHFREIRIPNVKSNKIYYFNKDPSYRKLQYVRYADDFLLGFGGSRFEAANILTILVQKLWFLCKLDVNPDKVQITHYKHWVLFLGYKIKGHYYLNVKWEKHWGQRVNGITLKLNIPLERLLTRFAERGFFQLARKGNAPRLAARRQDKYLFMRDIDIVKRFSSIVKNIFNYYCLSTHQHVFYELFYNLKRSCALTLAYKHKKRSALWAFDKYGKDLEITSKNSKKLVSFYFPNVFRDSYVKRKIKKDVSMKDLILKIQGTTVPTMLHAVCSASKLDCVIPNCPNKASHWQHVKHKKKYKGFDVERKLLSYTAKQIPICKEHQILIHLGKYDGPSLRKIRGYVPQDFLKD